MAKQYVPLNDYVLVVLIEETGGLTPPDKNDARDEITRGTIYNPGRYGKTGDKFAMAPDGQPLEVGDIVHWVKFSGGGRTTRMANGTHVAQIPYDRLTMVEREDSQND